MLTMCPQLWSNGVRWWRALGKYGDADSRNRPFRINALRILHASRIPTSPSKNNRQASCLDEGCAAECSSGVHYIRLATYVSTLLARSLHLVSGTCPARARYVDALGGRKRWRSRSRSSRKRSRRRMRSRKNNKRKRMGGRTRRRGRRRRRRQESTTKVFADISL